MILVVGANGFLGTEICKKLKIKKKKFIKIDKSLVGAEKIDINCINSLRYFFKKNSIKIIINCACEPATSKSKKKILETNGRLLDRCFSSGLLAASGKLAAASSTKLSD